MLTQLNISNYAITERIDLHFDPGMTVITGETGAGKSITLDGLNLALGTRADSRAVGPYADRAEIYAGFDIGSCPAAQTWFRERELPATHEVMLRRVVHADGKSRGYINGKPATLQDLKSLGATLVDIHGRHDHQSLLKRDNQRQLLDAYAGTEALADQVATQTRHARQLEQSISTLQNQDESQSARLQLLRYQVEELEQFAPMEREVEQLEVEQQALANAADNLTTSQQALSLCDDEPHGAGEALRRATQLLGDLPAHSDSISEALQLLDSARIQTEEATRALQAYITDTEVNPDRLTEVEERLSAYYHIARKHKISADQLPTLWQTLHSELGTMDSSEERIEQLQSQLRASTERRDQLAGQLSRQRQKAAKRLSKAVNSLLSQLSMPHCQFHISQTPLAEAGPHGSEHIEFLIGTHPERPPQGINKIASGGELSRIGLAIQVASSNTNGTPTLIFDEVDAGIGGGVAEVVGNLLRKLGCKRQVFCITHLPQVACKGDQHFRVAKQGGKHALLSEINRLGEDEKIAEIARMLGGLAITEQTLAHAAEMLSVQH